MARSVKMMVSRRIFTENEKNTAEISVQSVFNGPKSIELTMCTTISAIIVPDLYVLLNHENLEKKYTHYSFV